MMLPSVSPPKENAYQGQNAPYRNQDEDDFCGDIRLLTKFDGDQRRTEQNFRLGFNLCNRIVLA